MTKEKMKNIAILYGGNSSEFVISERSSRQILQELSSLPYNFYPIRVQNNEWIFTTNGNREYKVDLNDFSLILEEEKKVIFDFAFIIIHGTPGEDGKLQAYLDIQKIPYNTPGLFANALTFNKYACKLYLKYFDIATPEAVLYREGQEIDEDEILKKTGLPCFIKPNNGGSSFGTTKVLDKKQIKPAIREALKEDKEVIIESFVKGIELSCGLLKTKDEEYIFPVTEIVSKNEFFDFEAKYTEGMADEIVPARVPETIQRRCQEISSSIYDLTACKGLVRVDYILKGNQLFFLELNTVPGMSRESIVPKMIRAAGMTEKEVLRLIIDEGLSKD
ncbi:MAG: D-alanine--D-alanine ligase [Bacteroidota bacterium]